MLMLKYSALNNYIRKQQYLKMSEKKRSILKTTNPLYRIHATFAFYTNTLN